MPPDYVIVRMPLISAMTLHGIGRMMPGGRGGMRPDGVLKYGDPSGAISGARQVRALRMTLKLARLQDVDGIQDPARAGPRIPYTHHQRTGADAAKQ